MDDSGDQFHFNAPASGVFGSQRHVVANTFEAKGATDAILSEILSAIDQLNSDPSLAECAESLADVRGEIHGAPTPGALRAALTRARQISSAIGEDKTQLLGRRIEDILDRLDYEVRKALARLDSEHTAQAGTRPGEFAGQAFVSYVREDSQRVDRLHQVLEAAGIPVWRDTTALFPGDGWRVEIRRAISDNALVFIACFSQVSLARVRSYQNEELTLAIEQMRLRRPDEPWLIPVRLDECEIPDWDIGGGRTLASIQSVDLFEDGFDDSAARLVAAILRILGRRIA